MKQNGSDAPDAEAYRILRTNIEFNRKSARRQLPSPWSAAGPAKASPPPWSISRYICAQGGYNDPDDRRRLCAGRNCTPFSRHPNRFGGPDQLPHYGNSGLEDVGSPDAHVDNLYFMPSGIHPRPIAAGILNSQAHVASSSPIVKSRFDLVLIDSLRPFSA